MLNVTEVVTLYHNTYSNLCMGVHFVTLLNAVKLIVNGNGIVQDKAEHKYTFLWIKIVKIRSAVTHDKWEVESFSAVHF